jgi:hypothetical protein
MKMLGSDINNDLVIDASGSLSVLTGLDAIMSACEHKSKAQLTQMVLAYDEGMPNFQTIWNGSPNVAQFEASLRSVILSIDGVLEIESLIIQIADNTLQYTITIKTVYGTGVLNG